MFILILMHLSNELPSNSFHTEIIKLIVKELLKIVFLIVYFMYCLNRVDFIML